MKKIKLMIASLIGAIALVFACVIGSVNAATQDSVIIFNDYSSSKSATVSGVSYSWGSNKSASKEIKRYDNNTTVTVANGVKLTNKAGLTIESNYDWEGTFSYYLVGSTASTIVAKQGSTTVATGSNNAGTDGAFVETTISATKGTTIIMSSNKELGLYQAKLTLTMAEYTINYENSESFEVTLPSQQKNATSISSDMIPNLEHSGWRFTGWYFEAACTNKATTSSDLATYADNGSVTLYAGWEEINSYNIYFYNGSTLVSTKEVEISGTKKLTDWPENPTKTGWTFVGWFNGETQVDTDTVFSSDTTLNARFSSNNKIAIGSTATLNYTDSSLTVNPNKTDYYNSQTLGKFTIDSTSEKIKKESSFKFEIAGSTTSDYISFDIPANSKAKIVLNGMRSTSSSSTATFELTDGTNTINPATSVAKDTNSYYTIFTNNSSEDKTIYLYRKSGGNSKINEIIVSVIALDNDSIVDNTNLIFKTQYDASTAAASSKLRFIGYIQGISYDDYANIESIQFSFTFNGKDRVATVNNLYKSVKNGNDVILGAFDNAMYVVYTLRGINKEAYEGKALTNCKLTVNFVGGSSLEVAHDDVTLPSKFESYYTES